jgi:hypothetical protein
MANPSVLVLALEASDADGVCLSQTPGAASDLTINGALASGGVATFDVARRVLITAAGNDATVVFTVYGANRDGFAQSETITGLNASSDYTDRDFLTVTRVASSSATAGAITVGTNGIGSSRWVLDDIDAPAWALSVALSVTGTVTYTVEHTYDDPNKTGTSLVPEPEGYSLVPGGHVPAKAWAHASLTAKTTDAEGQYPDKPIMAHRVTITAGDGTVVLQSVQSRIGR